jgi:hypothetical protein
MNVARSAPLRFTLLLVLILGGCSANPEGTVRTNSDVLTRDELLNVNRGNLFEAVELLRPQWLRMRSDQSVNRDGGILVYMDEIRLGNLDALRTVSPTDVQEMRRFNATAASQRWGPGHSEGVIQITTRALR